MAGDWIKMRTNLDTDPAVVRMASGLKTDTFAIVGRLHKIWAWANEHLTDGHNVPIESAFLDKLVELSGFAEAMRSVGWLSGRDGSLCFPSFDRHNGASAKARALDAERKRNARKASENCPDANRTEFGPEERREESNKSPAQNAGRNSSSKRKAEPKYEPSDMEAARHLWDRITELAGDGQRPPDFEKWADDIRKVRELDGQSPEAIRVMIDVAHDDEFWRANILSPDKLRKKWLQLSVLQNKRSGPADPSHRLWQRREAQSA